MSNSAVTDRADSPEDTSPKGERAHGKNGRFHLQFVSFSILLKCHSAKCSGPFQKQGGGAGEGVGVRGWEGELGGG